LALGRPARIEVGGRQVLPVEKSASSFPGLSMSLEDISTGGTVLTSSLNGKLPQTPTPVAADPCVTSTPVCELPVVAAEAVLLEEQASLSLAGLGIAPAIDVWSSFGISLLDPLGAKKPVKSDDVESDDAEEEEAVDDDAEEEGDEEVDDEEEDEDFEDEEDEEDDEDEDEDEEDDDFDSPDDDDYDDDDDDDDDFEDDDE